MKYNVIISRTYATELVVEAENTIEVHKWLGDNDDKVNHEELEQCNIIETYTNVEALSPSPNEVSELQDLVWHIKGKLKEYRHVEDFIPIDMHKALAQMLGHDID
jgi:hypothetical protein